jgi:hypothetical protein
MSLSTLKAELPRNVQESKVKQAIANLRSTHLKKGRSMPATNGAITSSHLELEY